MSTSAIVGEVTVSQCDSGQDTEYWKSKYMNWNIYNNIDRYGKTGEYSIGRHLAKQINKYHLNQCMSKIDVES